MKSRKYQEFRKINKFLLGFVVLLFGVVVVLAGLEIKEINEGGELVFEESRIGLSPERVKGSENCDGHICETFKSLVASDLSVLKSSSASLSPRLEELNGKESVLLKEPDINWEELARQKTKKPTQADQKTFLTSGELKSDKLLLRNRKFELNGIDSHVYSYASDRRGKKMHAIMRFDDIPDFSEGRNLKNMGIDLISYVPNNGFIVSFDADNLERNSNLIDSVGINLKLSSNDAVKPVYKKSTLTGSATFGDGFESLDSLNERYNVKDLVKVSEKEYILIFPEEINMQKVIEDYKSNSFVLEAKSSITSGLSGIETLSGDDKLSENVKNKNFVFV